MTRLSRYPIKSSVREQIEKSLTWLLTHLTKEEELVKFLDDFLTETEKLLFAKRLAVAMMLEKGYSFYTIRDTLKVSTSTILKISQWLRKSGEGYKVAIKKLSEKEKLDEFWKIVKEAAGEFVEMVGKGKRVFPK